MHESLTKLAALPGETEVYCTHEYTTANLAFASAVEPGNTDLQSRIAEVRNLRANDTPSLPSTIALERRHNPSLRTAVAAVRSTAEHRTGQPLPNERRPEEEASELQSLIRIPYAVSGLSTKNTK